MPINLSPVTRAAQVARIAHNSTAPTLLGVPVAVWVLTRHNLEELAQDLISVMGLELGLQHLWKEMRGSKTLDKDSSRCTYLWHL